MDYREKVRLAEEALEKIEAGTSLEEIKAKLQGEGYHQDDIYAISGSIRKQINQKYEAQITTLLEEGREADIRTEIPNLPENETFELINKAKSQRYKALIYKVRNLRNSEAHSDEVLSFLASQHLNSTEINNIFEKVENEASEESSGSVSVGTLLLGVALIIGGIVLSMNTSSVFYGAVIVGISFVIKSVV